MAQIEVVTHQEKWALDIEHKGLHYKKESLACKLLWSTLILVSVVWFAIRPGQNDDTARVAIPGRRHDVLIEPVVV